MDSPLPQDPNDAENSSADRGIDQFARTMVVAHQDDEPSWRKLEVTRVIQSGTDAPDLTPPGGTPVPLDRLLVGTTLGDFQLLEKIGEGAMGAVYRARQISFDRMVALKVLFGHVANQPRLVERLYREARALAQLDHENIVQAYGVGEESGCHYVAMEFVEGRNLQSWLRHLGHISVADALRITIAIARGLAHAHEKGIIHRDIKPENILISKSGEVKVADLGMVKTIDEDMALTQTGHAIGTPWYMPLEQAKDAKNIDARSDLYALGCLLYCLVTGRPPFQGRTLVELIQAKERGAFPTARSQNSEVPERLDLILVKLIAKLPAHRYESADALIGDLEKLDLASDRLSFLGKSVDDATTETPRPRAAETIETAPEFDPNVWYVKMPSSPGKYTIRKQTTQQVQALLAAGKLKATVPISHFARQGFRSLSTFKEFSGAASKVTREATKSTTAIYRELYEQIEKGEERRDSGSHSKPVSNTSFYLEMIWVYGRIPLAVGIVGAFSWWAVSGLFR